MALEAENNILENSQYEDLIKWKTKIYHTVGTIPKSNIKVVERGNLDTPNIQTHDRSFSWLDTGTTIKWHG